MRTICRPSRVEDQLNYLLLRRNFQVFSPADSPAFGPSDPAEAIAPPRSLKDVDVMIIGEARAAPGLRTGDLISARAYLKLKVYDVRSRKELQSLELESAALDVSLERAARSALRRVADDSFESVVAYLLDAVR